MNKLIIVVVAIVGIMFINSTVSANSIIDQADAMYQECKETFDDIKKSIIDNRYAKAVELGKTLTIQSAKLDAFIEKHNIQPNMVPWSVASIMVNAQIDNAVRMVKEDENKLKWKSRILLGIIIIDSIILIIVLSIYCNIDKISRRVHILIHKMESKHVIE